MPTQTGDVLNFGEAKQKSVTINNIKTRNLANGLVVNLANPEDKEVVVQVIGVQSVIDNIDASDIEAYVDLTGYTVGENSAEVQIETNDSRAQYVVTKSVNLIISASK